MFDLFVLSDKFDLIWLLVDTIGLQRLKLNLKHVI